MDATTETVEIDRILFHRDTILKRVDNLAAEIREDYDGLPLSVIVLANGALFFAAELLLRLEMDIELDILSVSSYSGVKRGEQIIDRFVELKIDLCDRHVLVIDDIFDSGMTMRHVYDHLRLGRPKDLKSCVLLVKECERAHAERPDYFGFEVENEFVVGYGLDLNERFRNFPHIGVLSVN